MRVPEIQISCDRRDLTCEWIPLHLPTEKLLPLQILLVAPLDVAWPFADNKIDIINQVHNILRPKLVQRHKIWLHRATFEQESMQKKPRNGRFGDNDTCVREEQVLVQAY